MDPSLLRERDLFRKRALQLPAVAKRPIREEDGASKPRPSKRPKPVPKPKDFDYKASSAGTSQYKFSILTKIVRFMKQRHKEGDLYPLTIEEVLDETNQLDMPVRHKHWLVTEALANNPKIEVVEGDKYKFRPPYSVRDKKGLLRLLDKHDQRGLGGILLDDIEESLPNAAKALKNLGDQVTYITRPIDKKQVLFYNDQSCVFSVDEELQKLWRGVGVDGTDEGKIEDYLVKHGITSMADSCLKKVAPPKRKRGGSRKNRNFKSHNDHMSDVLQDYSQPS